MADNDRIVDEELIKELRQYRNTYNVLAATDKAELLNHTSPSAKALSSFLQHLNPEQTTYGQVKELIKLYYATQHIPAAKRALQECNVSTKLFGSVSPPLAGLRPITIHHVDKYLGEEPFKDEKGNITYARSNVQLASRAFFHDDSRQERLGQALLRHLIIKKDDITVEEMITRYPKLLSHRGALVDKNTNRTLVDINGKPLNDICVFDRILQQADPDLPPGDDTKQNFGQKLLHHTIRGNQLAVVAILAIFPDLLLHRGNTHDYSGRAFKNVTAFELAIWALDVRHMVPAMLKCLTTNVEGQDFREKLVPQLLRQFNHSEGVNYTIGCGLLKMSQDPRTLMPGKTDLEKSAELNRKLNRHNGLIQYDDKIFYFHNLSYPKKLVEIKKSGAISALQRLLNNKERELEDDTLQIINHDDELKMIQNYVPDSRHIFQEKHYDFTPLIKALEVYAHSFYADKPWFWEQHEAHWSSVVGLEQHYAPAHVAQHYCNPDESFSSQYKYNCPQPTFKENVLKRTLELDNWISNKKERWWTEAVDSSVQVSGPGLDFAIFRTNAGAVARDHSERRGIGGGPPALARSGTVDLEALRALCKVRTDDAHEIKQLLDSLQKPGASCVVQ